MEESINVANIFEDLMKGTHDVFQKKNWHRIHKITEYLKEKGYTTAKNL